MSAARRRQKVSGRVSGMFQDPFELPIVLFLFIYGVTVSLLFLSLSRRRK